MSKVRGSIYIVQLLASMLMLFTTHHRIFCNQEHAQQARKTQLLRDSVYVEKLKADIQMMQIAQEGRFTPPQPPRFMPNLAPLKRRSSPITVPTRKGTSATTPPGSQRSANTTSMHLGEARERRLLDEIRCLKIERNINDEGGI